MHQDVVKIDFTKSRVQSSVSGLTHTPLLRIQVNELASARHELASAKNPKFTNLHFQLTTFMMVYSDMEPSLEDLRACGC